MATNDLITVAEARAVVGIGAGDSKAAGLLPSFVTAVSDLLDDRVGPVVYATITEELHDGGGQFFLVKSPVQAVTQVVEYDSTTAATLTAETNSTKPDDGYLADLDVGTVWRRSGGADALFPAGRQNVLVTYVAGRYTTTATVGAQFKLAAELTLKNAWRTQEDSSGADGEFEFPQTNYPRFAIPNSVKDLLAAEWRAVEF